MQSALPHLVDIISIWMKYFATKEQRERYAYQQKLNVKRKA